MAVSAQPPNPLNLIAVGRFRGYCGYPTGRCPLLGVLRNYAGRLDSRPSRALSTWSRLAGCPLLGSV